MKNLRLAIAAFLISSFIGCKDKEVLPSTTQEGKNTFGLKANGSIWLPQVDLSIAGTPPKLASTYHHETGLFGIVARKGVSDEIFVLTVSGLKSTGLFSFNIEENNGASKSTYSGKLVNEEYTIPKNGINQIEITKLDTINQVISGFFKCEFTNKNRQSTVNVTDGIFDVKYEK